MDAIDTLRSAAREVVRELGLLGDAYQEIGITLAERHLLIVLSQALYPDVKEIASRLLLDKSTASRLIAKAVKKGFICYSDDINDKRRKCLQLTKKGIETLAAFEKIAKRQTKKALEVLSPEEAQYVMKGVELYAKGLKRSRLMEEFTISKMERHDEIPIVQAFKGKADLKDLFSKFSEKGSIYYVVKKGGKIYAGGGISSNAKGVKVLSHLHITPEGQELGIDSLLENFLKKK